VIPVFSARNVEAAVSPARAVEAVRDAFVAYARGEWSMPPKVYVPAYPAGDFRAMPAIGAGHALLKWVTSFPGNPTRGLPTVSGLVLLSDASDGSLRAVLDASAVTALRTGAAAVLAAEELGRRDAETAAVIGAGVNGRAAARTFLARGRSVMLWDVDRERSRRAAEELGAGLAASREEALAADLLVTVTPGHEILLPEGSLRVGQHVSLMGADGPGKAEIAVGELKRVHVFCDDWEQARPEIIPGPDARVRAFADDWEQSEPSGTLDPTARVRLYADDWEQASHNGDLAHAVEAGAITQDDVTQLGDVLAGTAAGRQSKDDITIFDSTGLAIQDLAVALAAMEKADELELPSLDL
jgi:ornithine cyclodeaminase/alanine dehydrogenase-like protein (mu-crystallin family)